MKLGKKVGPLPVWAWAAIGLAVVGYLYLRSRSQPPPTPSTSDQPGQASGAATDPNADQGGAAPAGIDPSILAALFAQNDSILHSLTGGGFMGGGGNFGGATGSPYDGTPTSGPGPTPDAGPVVYTASKTSNSGSEAAAPMTNTVSMQQGALSGAGSIGTYHGPSGAGGGKNTL